MWCRCVLLRSLFSPFLCSNLLSAVQVVHVLARPVRISCTYSIYITGFELLLSQWFWCLNWFVFVSFSFDGSLSQNPGPYYKHQHMFYHWGGWYWLMQLLQLMTLSHRCRSWPKTTNETSLNSPSLWGGWGIHGGKAEGWDVHVGNAETVIWLESCTLMCTNVWLLTVTASVHLACIHSRNVSHQKVNPLYRLMI